MHYSVYNILFCTCREFDREKKASYTFQVIASDGGLYGPREQSVRVDIILDDVNDNAPVFEQVPFRVNISQNHGLGQYVLQVSAKDADQGSNGEVMYNLAEESIYFDIDSFSGVIVTRRVLDAAAVKLHHLEVRAVDKGQPPLTATGLVEIRVGNAAGFSALTFLSDTYEVTMKENSPSGTPVVTVQATNPRGPSSTITYNFASGNEASIFKISSTGTQSFYSFH